MIVEEIKCEGLKEEIEELCLTGSPKGLRAFGPGALKEDRLMISAKTGELRAEREYGGEDKERITIVIEKTISKNKAQREIERILKPYRRDYRIKDMNYTTITAWDKNGSVHKLIGGHIDRELRRFGIDLDRPVPGGPEIKVDKSSC